VQWTEGLSPRRARTDASEPMLVDSQPPALA
jgi:hypothetical protein